MWNGKGAIWTVKERRNFTDTILVGIAGALVAQLFTWMLVASERLLLFGLAGYRPPGLVDEGGLPNQIIGSHGLLWIPIATTVGGLIAGFLVYSLAPEAEGHGTDTAVKAYHQNKGRLRARVAPLKMLASAITIGSGGAAGREGPIALISSSIGATYAGFRNRSEEDRRLLVLVGMASGLSAIFRSPIGSAIFAIEVLYAGMDLEAGALLYTMLGSLTGYVVNGLFVGWRPLFHVSAGLSITDSTEYLWFAALGLASGVLATFIPIIFYGMRDAFKSLPVPNHFKPAVGGLAIGLLAIPLPQVLAGGYGWIQAAIDGRLALNLLLVLSVAKIFALSFTVSSGGSGGVFAPSLFAGAMLGGFFGLLFHLPSQTFVIVGMAAVFAGAARVPIATLLMVTEMTGGYKLLAPAGLAVMLSFLVQITVSGRNRYGSLYEAQVRTRIDSPAHHAEHLRAAMEIWRRHAASLPPSIGHVDLVSLMESGVPIDLPDEKCMILGTLKPESPCVGKHLHSCLLTEKPGETEVFGLLRKGNALLTNNGAVMKAGDRVLAIVPRSALDQIARHCRLFAA